MTEPEGTLHLPIDFSLGRITVYVNGHPLEPAEIFEARGTIRVSKKAKLFLDLSQEVCDELRRIHLVPPSLLSNGISILQKRLEKADFREFRTITDLKSLSVSLCPVIRVEQLRQLGMLTSLEHLSLSSTELDSPDFSWVPQFPNLRTLNLFGVGADDRCLAFLSGLAALQQLDLSRARLSDEGVQSLWQFRHLKALSLGECQVGDEALRGISHSFSLHTLKLPGTRISDNGVELIAREFGSRKSDQLKFLELQSCQITDRSVVYLASLRSLSVIGLRETNVTPEAVAFLRRSLPKCRIMVEQVKL
jgi:Leucine-rich repeat (LRR) protein